MADVFSVRVGETLRVPYRGAHVGIEDVRSYLVLTRGTHKKPADLQKGIFFYEQFLEPGHTFNRTPAFILHSNPFKRGAEGTPWVDVVEPDEGYCLFHGDNRRPGAAPFSSRGNGRFIRCMQLFADPALRRFAPPVLVFQQIEHNGSRRGYRRFCGFGVPARCALATQKEKRGEYFTNLVIELVLFKLDRENEQFRWHWIDQRRNPLVTADQALDTAPASWRDWVRRGDSALDSCRRFVARQTVVKPGAQAAKSEDERKILREVLSYHQDKKHAFEGLASYVAQRVLGDQLRRGWVTRRSGDGGIDFICRLDVGSPGDRLSRTSAVVLGQAKCVSLGREISGLELARVVARLQRGWIGVFVTTGLYSRAAQLELAEDRYPIVLINGHRLARELLDVVTRERISLTELLERESVWYTTHQSNLSPTRILEDAFSFDAVATPESLRPVDRG